MCKTGIIAYILTAIFVVFCFWAVGCSTDDCEETNLASSEYTSSDCVVEYRDSSDTDKE